MASIYDATRHIKFRKPKASYDERREEVMRSIWRDRELTYGERLIGVIIAMHLNRRSFQAWPSNTTLASETGIDRRTIQRSIKRLTARGHFALVQHGGGRSSNRYAPNAKVVELTNNRGVAPAPPLGRRLHRPTL